MSKVLPYFGAVGIVIGAIIGWTISAAIGIFSLIVTIHFLIPFGKAAIIYIVGMVAYFTYAWWNDI